MRDIKFRVWNGTAMCYGGFWIHACGETLPSGINSIKKDRPVMQFTGLKDKNGHDIYEGDIVKVVIDGELEGFNHLVEWNDSACCYVIDVEKGDYDMTTMSWAEENDGYEYEIIGDIHQNPELLKPEVE